MTLRRVDTQTHLTNAGSHMLAADVTPERPLRVKRGNVIAGTGDVGYYHESDDRSSNEPKIHGLRWRRERKRTLEEEDSGAVATEFDGLVVGAGYLKAHRTAGTGRIYLGRDSGDVAVFELSDDRLRVIRTAHVLAYDNVLQVELAKELTPPLATFLATKFVWSFSGTGQFGIATDGEALIVPVEPGADVKVDVASLIAFTGDVSFSAPEGNRARMAKRNARWVLKNFPGLGLDLGRERVWLNVAGEGQLLVCGVS